jgi:hypothetical protein
MINAEQIMSPATPGRISDKEVQARAKMASFIDRVIEAIQSTSPRNQETAENSTKAIRTVAPASAA